MDEFDSSRIAPRVVLILAPPVKCSLKFSWGASNPRARWSSFESPTAPAKRSDGSWDLLGPDLGGGASGVRLDRKRSSYVAAAPQVKCSLIRPIVLAIVFACSAIASPSLAEEKDELSAEMETAFREFAEKAVETRLEKVSETVEKDTTAQDAKAEKLRVELENHFLRCEEIAITRVGPIMDTEIAQLKQLAGIDEQRLDALKAAGKSAVEGTVEEWLQRWKNKVYEMDEAQRKQRTSNQAIPTLDISNGENPKNHQAWKEGLAKVLSEAELANVEKRRADLRGARAEALAMVLVGELDPFVGFTVEQRTKLSKLFAKSLLALPDHYYVAHAQNSYSSINTGQLFTQISGIVKTELLPLLDEGQAQRWKSITSQTLVPNQSTSRVKLDELEIPPAEEIDAIAAQRLMTGFLVLHAKEYTRNHRVKMDVKVDGIARMGNLAVEKITLLRTAAKGAAQTLAKNDINNFESWVRQNFQNVAPTDLPARFKTTNLPTFSNRGTPVDLPIWTGTIDRVLSADQKQAWDAQCEARTQWNKDSKIAILMTEIDKVVLLAPEKRDSLEEILGPVLADYQEDLDSMFSFQWHIQGYYSMVPLSLLSDEELAPALDKEQIGVVRARNPGHFDQMIESLKSNRKSRVKAEKKK